MASNPCAAAQPVRNSNAELYSGSKVRRLSKKKKKERPWFEAKLEDLGS